MSNDRHLDIDNGTIGNLFRRATLAALGLDALDDVTEQSFEVIDRADAFTDRILGGISGVMPKRDFAAFGTQTTALADHIMDGMAGLNGPANATDLGDWQYWLDAALLMLFDDEEEEVALTAQKATSVKKTSRVQNTTPEAVRERIVALKKSGLTPAMIQAIPQAQKKSLLAKIQHAQSEKKEAAPHSIGEVSSDIIAKTLRDALVKTPVARAKDKTFTTQMIAQAPHQILASRMFDKATSLSLHTDDAHTSETQALVQQWTQSVSRLAETPVADMSNVRQMFSSLDALEKIGAVSRQQAASLRLAGQGYARRVLSEEISHDVARLAKRMNEMASKTIMASAPELQTQRAFSTQTTAQPYASAGITGSVRPETSVESADAIQRAFASIGAKLEDFNSAVTRRISQEGESAATLRWQRAADRFVRFQGISDDVDRVLLKDIVESAAALGTSGIIPQNVLEQVAHAATRHSVSHPDVISASTPTQNSPLSESSVSRALLSAPGFLSRIAAHVESSVDSLVNAIESFSGSVEPTKIQAFVSGIKALTAQGKSALTDAMSMGRASAVIASICDRLDEFAQTAATGAVSMGYDDLTSEHGTFIATDKNAEPQASGSAQTREAVTSISKLRSTLESIHAKAIAQAKQEIESSAAHSKNPKLHDIVRQLADARTAHALEQAQKAIENQLTSAQKRELAQTVEAARRSETRLENVVRQSRLIENATRLSEQLRQTLRESNKSKQVMLDGVQLHDAYLPALTQTLSSYAKIRNDYRMTSGGQTRTSASAIGMNDDRLERMLTTILPVTAESSKPSFEQIASADLSSWIHENTTILGYDEIIPASRSMIQNSHRDARYPSHDTVSDLTSMLGVTKAVEHHIAEIASGRPGGVEALAQTLTKLESANLSFNRSDVISYSVAEDGDRVKIALDVSKKSQGTPSSFALRHQTGSAYMPETARIADSVSGLSASIQMSKQAQSLGISGVADFVPVMAGAHVGSPSANVGQTHLSVNAQTFNAGSLAQASNLQGSNTQASIDQTSMMAGIAGRLGIESTRSLSDNRVQNIQLRVAGVDFDMTPSAFVQMLAKPVVESAAYAAPALTNAKNVLFSGYASLMNTQGERRTIKSLRHAYIDALTKAGTKSAHAEIGFNTQSFGGILGGIPEYGQRTFHDAQTSRTWIAEPRTVSSSAQDTSLSNTVIEKSEPVVVQPGSVGTTDFSWVSNALGIQSRRTGTSSASASGEREAEHQVLAKIDQMLDYVETMSSRDVGVFSSDETVRVLLEALPESGKLGNKGLPKWRQKDTKASRVAEARELRDALAKIGASPIQGTQRYANKQYVSPNLIAGGNAATPLFSGGLEPTSVPGGAANASGANDAKLDTPNIPTEDLEVLAEEVFQKIVDSFNEELQRRRSE